MSVEIFTPILLLPLVVVVGVIGMLPEMLKSKGGGGGGHKKKGH